MERQEPDEGFVKGCRAVEPHTPGSLELYDIETTDLPPAGEIFDMLDGPLTPGNLEPYDFEFLDVKDEKKFKLEHSDEDLLCFPTLQSKIGRKTAKKVETKCNMCNKYVTQMRKHILVHTREKPYICKVCKDAFSQKSNLNRHVKSKHAPIAITCNICGKNVKRKDKMKPHISKEHPTLNNPAA